jgi:hypothetical protein
MKFPDLQAAFLDGCDEWFFWAVREEAGGFPDQTLTSHPTPRAAGFAAAAQALVEAFPARGDDRLFLNCWIPQSKLQAAIERSMEAAGDPQRWWDLLEID